MTMSERSASENAHLEQLLDEALAGTFPASDPVGSLTAEKRHQGESAGNPPPVPARSGQSRDG